MGKPSVASTRIDKWLSATRLFKSRSQAQAACEAGRVSVNDVTVKASRTVSVGDTVRVRSPRGLLVAVVLGIEEKRQGPARARLLYEDRSPPPRDEDVTVAARPRGAGRPTKAERRAIARLIGDDSDS